MKKLKSKTGVSSLEEHKKILMSRIGALQTEGEGNQAALAISRAKVKDFNEKLASISPTVVTQETKGAGIMPPTSCGPAALRTPDQRAGSPFALLGRQPPGSGNSPPDRRGPGPVGERGAYPDTGYYGDQHDPSAAEFGPDQGDGQSLFPGGQVPGFENPAGGRSGGVDGFEQYRSQDGQLCSGS